MAILLMKIAKSTTLHIGKIGKIENWYDMLVPMPDILA
jgi:hypothetical protein